MPRNRIFIAFCRGFITDSAFFPNNKLAAFTAEKIIDALARRESYLLLRKRVQGFQMCFEQHHDSDDN